jgi:hypothetical protein
VHSSLARSSLAARALALACAALTIGMPTVASTFDTNSPGMFGGAPPLASALETSAPIAGMAPAGITQLSNVGLGNSVAQQASTQNNILNDMTGAHAIKTNAGETGPVLTGLDRAHLAMAGAYALTNLASPPGGCKDSGLPALRGSALDSPGAANDELDLGGMTPMSPGGLSLPYTCN